MLQTAATDGDDVNVALYFTDHFGVDPEVLDAYGAFDICVVSDLPLFIDPFLLFNSTNETYQALHDGIVEYLRFLKRKAAPDLDPGLLASWYRFKEVKQNWLGFTMFGNAGQGLGSKFASALNDSLGTILAGFGEETVTRGTHLEKLLLIRSGVGRDNISDFTTNLIKHYLLEYTQEFARGHIDPSMCADFPVTRAVFNYNTESWETRTYYLPRLRGDFVLLTPTDLLTVDDTWINYGDMIHRFDALPSVIDDLELRAKVNNFFANQLSRSPTPKERAAAAERTFREFPYLIDLYIKEKEDTGDQAVASSTAKAKEVHDVLVEQVKKVVPDIAGKTEFYDRTWTSYEECLERVLLFKRYVEDQDGYRLINDGGKGFSSEKKVQLFFGLILLRTQFDINREPNNGRGPVDFKASKGALDKSLIELKLASNSSLERNLQKQVEIYGKANGTERFVKVIICYTAADTQKIARILKRLGIEAKENVVVIDARSDNKPSASKA